MSYTNIFGGYNINTAFPSYANYELLDNETLQLTWASSFIDNSNVTAQINDLVSETDDNKVMLADAKLISAGQSIQFNNVGSNGINIFDFKGALITTIPPTDENQIILYLQDNSTSGGTWGITHLGAGTSSADASALSGFGTVALGSQINTNFPGKTINANYQVLSSDRASILVWTGGSGTVTLPNQLAGFYVAVNNEGSGSLVITTPDGKTIDGQNSFSLNPSESSYFIGVETNWNTLGFGVESFFQVNVLAPINLSVVGATTTLTNQQSSRLVQQYTGNLAQNVTVYYPAGAGQWYIWNNTTGAFNVTAQLVGPTGSPIVIPQGERVILYSDGTTIYNTPTIATSAIFNDGTAGIPGISFTSDTSTGFYKLPDGVVGYSSQGTQSVAFGGEAAGYGLGILGQGSCRFWNDTNTAYAEFKAANGTTSYIMELPPGRPTGASNMLYGNNALNMHFSNANYPVTTIANQLLYSSATNTITGLATANNGVLITSAGGVPSIASTLPAAVQGNITALGTITAGVWNGTPTTVPFGGTGNTTFTAYSVICAGTTATGNFQNAVGLGTADQVFTSNGAGALPSWKSLPAGVSAATKSQQQAASSSTSVYVSPGRQQYHPSAASAWVVFDGTSGNIINSYNVSAVSKIGTGIFRITVSAFTDNNYLCFGTVQYNNIRVCVIDDAFTPTTTQIQVKIYAGSVPPADSSYVNCLFYGELA